MKRAKMRRLVAEVIAARPLPSVTLKTVVVDFEDRHVTVSGRRFQCTERYFMFPIVAGSVAVMPKWGEEIVEVQP